MKKKISLIITAIVAVLAIVATTIVIVFFTDKPAKKKVVIKKVVVVTEDEETSDDNNSQQDNFYQDDPSNDVLPDGLYYPLKKITSTNIGANYYVVTLKNEHPGVVGYDAEYEVVVYNKMGHKIPNDELDITVNNSDIKSTNGILNIPYFVRKNAKSVVISVKNKTKKYLTGEYTFNFKKFTDSTTFKDDFNALNTSEWLYQKTNGKESDKAYVEDGCLVLKSENGNSNTNLTSVFKQAYGCFSVRMKMPEKGLANSVFSLMTNQRYIKNEDLVLESGGEITVVEYFPYWKEKWSSCVRWFGWKSYSKKSRNDELVCKDISSKFHNYSVVWTPESIFWYLDGKLVNTYTGEGVGKGSSAMNLCLKLTSYENDNYRGGPYEPDAFPFSVKIDSVEAYGLIEE